MLHFGRHVTMNVDIHDDCNDSLSRSATMFIEESVCVLCGINNKELRDLYEACCG